MIDSKHIGIGEKEIPKIAPQVDTFFDEKSRLIFSYKPASKSYEPIAYNAEVNDDGDMIADEIQENDIFHHFIVYIRFSSMITNKANGQVISGKMDTYQWHIAFEVILSVVAADSIDIMCAISRQAKFSGLYKPF